MYSKYLVMTINNIPFCLNASGHLPVKLPDYNNRLRVLVATYVTFSPDGTELLVNMGGEQVMLVGTDKGWQEKLLVSILLPKRLLFDLGSSRFICLT